MESYQPRLLVALYYVCLLRLQMLVSLQTKRSYACCIKPLVKASYARLTAELCSFPRYALLSDPVSACNLAADDNDGLQIVATVIMGVITGLVTVYVILSGSKLLNAFDLSQVRANRLLHLRV